MLYCYYYIIQPVPLTIIQHPASRIRIEQESILLLIQAFGSKPLTYQWLKNDQMLSDSSSYEGSNTATLLIRGRDSCLRGHYCCEVSDRCGKTLRSNRSELTVGKRNRLQKLSDAVLKLYCVYE